MTMDINYKNVKTAILIPTLCRHKHLEKCLDSLMKNPWAKYVDLYIALDYPASDAHWPGYREILKLMDRDYSIFRSFHLVKRPVNYGAENNYESLLKDIVQDYDQFIYMEDDTEFSENYLEYMLKALDYFRDDSDVISVSGYSYPVKLTKDNNCNIITQNAIFNMWGAGFWVDKYKVFWKAIDDNLCLIRDYPYNIRHYKFSNYRRDDYINFVAGVDPDDKDVRKKCLLFTSPSDISMGVYMQIKGQYQAMPCISKVRNNGFDGSGLYCQTVKPRKFGKVTSDTYDYSKQPIDQKKSFTLRYDGGKSRSYAFQQLNNFVKPGLANDIKSNIKLVFYRIFGNRKLEFMRIHHRLFRQ